MQTRRQFGKTIMGAVPTIALAGGLGITTMGLSCGSIFTDIEDYVPIGLEAFQEVLNLISPAEGAALATIITAVKATFADLTTVISNYQNAPAADKSTLIGKITTAINAVMQELQQFWNDANLPSGTLASTIEGVLQVVISTLAAFLPLLGGVLLPAKKLGKTIPIIPYTKSQLKTKTVKANVNAVFAKYGYSNHIY
jgi:phage-related protein